MQNVKSAFDDLDRVTNAVDAVWQNTSLLYAEWHRWYSRAVIPLTKLGDAAERMKWGEGTPLTLAAFQVRAAELPSELAAVGMEVVSRGHATDSHFAMLARSARWLLSEYSRVLAQFSPLSAEFRAAAGDCGCAHDRVLHDAHLAVLSWDIFSSAPSANEPETMRVAFVLFLAMVSGSDAVVKSQTLASSPKSYVEVASQLRREHGAAVQRRLGLGHLNNALVPPLQPPLTSTTFPSGKQGRPLDPLVTEIVNFYERFKAQDSTAGLKTIMVDFNKGRDTDKQVPYQKFKNAVDSRKRSVAKKAKK